MNKLLLLSSLFLTGCIGDILYLPVYATKQIIGGDRSFLPKNPDLGDVNKEELDKNVDKLIATLDWIDNYNRTTNGEKIKLYVETAFGEPLEAYIISTVRLPALWLTGDHTVPTGRRFDPERKVGIIYTEEDNELNNFLYPDLPKYYQIAYAGEFLYALDKMKERNKTYPNIPGKGLATVGGNDSLWTMVFTKELVNSGAWEGYFRSIFTYPNWDYSNAISRPETETCKYFLMYKKYLKDINGSDPETVNYYDDFCRVSFEVNPNNVYDGLL